MRVKVETTHNRDIALIVLVQAILNPITAVDNDHLKVVVDNSLLRAKAGNLKAVGNLLVDHNLITLLRKIQEVLRLSSVLPLHQMAKYISPTTDHPTVVCSSWTHIPNKSPTSSMVVPTKMESGKTTKERW
jgi:hypothetical protein